MKPDAKWWHVGYMNECQQALDRMQTSKLPQAFGKAGSPGVQVALPITIPDGESTNS